MVDAAAWRQRAHSMGGSLVSNLEVLAGKDIGSADSPRAGDGDHAGSMLHFVSGSLDLEVCGSLLPSFSLCDAPPLECPHRSADIASPPSLWIPCSGLRHDVSALAGMRINRVLLVVAFSGHLWRGRGCGIVMPAK